MLENFDLDTFRRNAERRIAEFQNPSLKKPKVSPSPASKGLIVHLAVRRKRLAFDELFPFESTSISRLQARIEAERAAKDAGYPIIGYVVDYINND